jgi:hypothetical protein
MTQQETIDWSKGTTTPRWSRVRPLNDKKKSDHWRAG